MASPVVWFDIPASDLDRAVRFYSAVLGKALAKEEFPGAGIAIFPHDEGETSGCLFRSTEDPPSAHGPLLYFDCGGRLDEAVEAARAHGGAVLTPKHAVGAYGFRAIVRDSEGNRIALHSPP